MARARERKLMGEPLEFGFLCCNGTRLLSTRDCSTQRTSLLRSQSTGRSIRHKKEIQSDPECSHTRKRQISGKRTISPQKSAGRSMSTAVVTSFLQKFVPQMPLFLNVCNLTSRNISQGTFLSDDLGTAVVYS